MKLGILCHACRGVGTVPASDIDSSPEPCSPCGGTGYEGWGEVDSTDLEDKLTDIKEKVDEIKAIVQAL